MTNARGLSLLAASLASLAVVACGSKESKPTTPSAETDPDDADAPDGTAKEQDPAQGCVALFTRLRDCTDQFIPALVRWRVELDVPAGIAQIDADNGRDALIATAMEEWKNDSTDGAIATMCSRIVESVPAEQLDGMMKVGRECVAKNACTDVVACIEPMQRARLNAQKAAESDEPAVE